MSETKTLEQELADDLKPEELPPSRREQAWRTGLKNRDTRAIVFDILEQCCYGMPAHIDGLEMMPINSGKQEIGHTIMQVINALSPDAYHLMTQEAKEDLENERHTTDTTGGNATTSNN